jgi:DNA-binding PadR family transcriptional regulator
VEPKRLAQLGYLEATKEPGKTRERTVYTLTDKGLQALREYARTPVRLSPLKSDPLLRLLICDLTGEQVTRDSMATLRDDIADVKRRLDDAEHRAAHLPHREKYLLIAVEFLRRYVELHDDLIDRVERELGARSVAFPAISTGIYGFPVERAAPIALREAAAAPAPIDEVRFVLFSDRDLDVYRRAAGQ